MACRGPSSSSAVRLAAYDTERVGPSFDDRGGLTFQAEVRHEVATSTTKRSGCGYRTRKERQHQDRAGRDDAPDVDLRGPPQAPPRPMEWAASPVITIQSPRAG